MHGQFPMYIGQCAKHAPMSILTQKLFIYVIFCPYFDDLKHIDAIFILRRYCVKICMKFMQLSIQRPICASLSNYLNWRLGQQANKSSQIVKIASYHRSRDRVNPTAKSKTAVISLTSDTTF